MSLASSYPSPHPPHPLPRSHPTPTYQLQAASPPQLPQPALAGHPQQLGSFPQAYVVPPGSSPLSGTVVGDHQIPPTPQTASYHPQHPHHPAMTPSGQQYAASVAAAASPTPSSATNKSSRSKYSAPLSPPPSSPLQGPSRPSSSARRPAKKPAGGAKKARPNKSGSSTAGRSESILSVRERKRNGGANVGGGGRRSIAASSSAGSSNPPTPNPPGSATLGEGWTPTMSMSATAPMMTPALTTGSTAASVSPEISFTGGGGGVGAQMMGRSNSRMGSQAPKARTLGLGFGAGVVAMGSPGAGAGAKDGGGVGSMEAVLAGREGQSRDRERRDPAVDARPLAKPGLLRGNTTPSSLAQASVTAAQLTAAASPWTTATAATKRERSGSATSSSTPTHGKQAKRVTVAVPNNKRGGQVLEKPVSPGSMYHPGALVTPPPQHRQIPARQQTPQPQPQGLQAYPTPQYTQTADFGGSVSAETMYATPTRGGGDRRSAEEEAERAVWERAENEKKEIMAQLARHGIYPSLAVFSAALELVAERQASAPTRPPPTIEDFAAALRHVEEVRRASTPIAPPKPATPALTTTAKRGRKQTAPAAVARDVKGKGHAAAPMPEARAVARAQVSSQRSTPTVEPKIIAMPAMMPRLEEPLVMTMGLDGRASLQFVSAAAVAVAQRKVATPMPYADHLGVEAYQVPHQEPTPDPTKVKRIHAFASPAMPGSSSFPAGVGAPGPLVMSVELVAAQVPGRGRIKIDKAQLVRELGEEAANLAITAATVSPQPKGPTDETWKGRNQVWTPPSSAMEGLQGQSKTSWPDGIRRFGGVMDQKSRIGRIEAWLDSPEGGDRSELDDGAGFWTTLPSEWYETEEKEAMDRARTRAALRRYATGQDGDEVEEYVTVSGGKTLRRLVRYRKRAYDADSMDAEAEGSNKRHCSERRMTETEKVSCICTKGDDETAMVQCDGCRVWYHLACLDISEDDELPDVWHCFRCTRGPLPKAVRYRQEPTLVHVPYSPRIDHFYGSSAPHHLALAPSPMPAPTASAAQQPQPERVYNIASPSVAVPQVNGAQYVTPKMNPGGFIDWSRVNYSPRSPVHRRTQRFASMTGTPGLPSASGEYGQPHGGFDEFDNAWPWSGPFATPRTASGFAGQWDEDVVERRPSVFCPPGTPVRTASQVFATPQSWRRPSRHFAYNSQSQDALHGLRSPGDVPSSPPQEMGPPWSPVPPNSKSRGHRRHGSGSVSFATTSQHYRTQSATAPYSHSPGFSVPYAKSSHTRSAVFGGPSSAVAAAAAKLTRDDESGRSASEGEKRSHTPQSRQPHAAALGPPISVPGKGNRDGMQAGLGIGFGEASDEDLNGFLGM